MYTQTLFCHPRGLRNPASLGGPMAEQIVDAFRQPLGDTLLKAMPANALYRNAIS